MITSNSFFENTFCIGLIASLIASFLTIAIMNIWKYYKRKISNWKFKKIFGTYEEEKLFLVLPELKIRPDLMDYLKNNKFHDYSFPFINSNKSYISTSKILPYNDTTALKYLLDIISSKLGNKSLITTDEELSKKLDLSFISFGGSTFYSSHVLSDSDNIFYKVENNSSIVSIKDTEKRFVRDKDFDYGLIIKYKHNNFPDRVWIVISGIGESGTSGAGWYLSKRWAELSDEYHNKAFGLVVKVKHGIDESTIKVDSIVGK